MVEQDGDGKSAVTTPNGRSERRKSEYQMASVGMKLLTAVTKLMYVQDRLPEHVGDAIEEVEFVARVLENYAHIIHNVDHPTDGVVVPNTYLKRYDIY